MGEPQTRGHDLDRTGLEAIAARVRSNLESRNTARELALRKCREIIQASARAIRAVHRGEHEQAREWVGQAQATVAEVRTMLGPYPDLYWAGYVHDAQKEYVEAEVVRALVLGRSLPEPEELGVEDPAYLNGLAEAGSECRRYVLDRLREGDMATGERVMRAMDEIYDELMTFDFPDAITAGLRRTVDAFRAVLERTRGDLTLTHQQKALHDALMGTGLASRAADG